MLNLGSFLELNVRTKSQCVSKRCILKAQKRIFSQKSSTINIITHCLNFDLILMFLPLFITWIFV